MGRRRISLARSGEIQLRLRPGEGDLVRSLVAQLPLLYREPLQLWSQGWSYREIAEVVERTP